MNTIEFKTLFKRTGFPQETQKVFDTLNMKIQELESRLSTLEAILAKMQQKE